MKIIRNYAMVNIPVAATMQDILAVTRLENIVASKMVNGIFESIREIIVTSIAQEYEMSGLRLILISIRSDSTLRTITIAL